MTIITTEIQKWKRNKIVWCILALTLLLGAFAIERACSISRSSPFMDSFGDLYTLAFKNLSSLFLPIVLGMFATTLFFDEHKNDTMKELLIIPITKAQLYFSKVAVVILMSVGLCLITSACRSARHCRSLNPPPVSPAPRQSYPAPPRRISVQRRSPSDTLLHSSQCSQAASCKIYCWFVL